MSTNLGPLSPNPVYQVAVKQVGAGSPRPKKCCITNAGRGNPTPTEPHFKFYRFDGNLVLIKAGAQSSCLIIERARCLFSRLKGRMT